MGHHDSTGTPQWEDFLTCDHGPDPAFEPPALSRRVAIAAAAVTPLFAGALTATSARAAGDPASVVPPDAGIVRAALHVHASFSEGNGGLRAFNENKQTQGSMESHIDTLGKLGFDLVMFTDHDHRMAGRFGGSNKPWPGAEDFRNPTPKWAYWPVPNGTVKGNFTLNSTGMMVNASGNGTGTMLVHIACPTLSWEYRSNLTGTTLVVTAAPPAQGTAEFWVLTSHRPATAGRPEGNYSVRYRIDRAATTRRVTTSGNQVVVTVPGASGMADYGFRPGLDLDAAFPDLGFRAQDFGLYGVFVGANPGTSGATTAVFQKVQFKRTQTLASAISLQSSLIDQFQPMYPGIAIAQGLEMSYGQHMNWLSPDSRVAAQEPVPGESVSAYLRRINRTVADRGGVSTYNHPFGATRGPLLNATDRAAAIKRVTTKLLGSGLYGADYLEVGYYLRGGVDLEAHLEVWDNLLATGLKVYANGVSDNHGGSMQAWMNDGNFFATDVITSSASPGAVVPAMANGRAFVSSFMGYGGMLDLQINDRKMGSTVASSATSVPLSVTATDIPNGGKVRVVQYPVHGNATRGPAVRDTSWGPLSGSNGSTTFGVATGPSYVRAEIRDTRGLIVAFSNPLWIS